MTQNTQTSAVSAERPAVINREALWDTGAIVRIKVPTGAKRASFVGKTGTLFYYLFDQSVKNGGVRCHVHLKGEDSPELRGKELTAKVTLWKKTMSDGRQYLYVDFVPIADSAKATHRLAIVPQSSDVAATDGWTIFETPKPLQGAVIFAPPDAKVALSAHDKAEAFLAGMRERLPVEIKQQLENETTQAGAKALASRWGAKVSKLR